jgi:Arc/MetJ-type ribon-helix-helix transcriptional regulator
MAKLKVAVTLDAGLLDQVDTLVRERRFPNRSQAIESALAEKLAVLLIGSAYAARSRRLHRAITYRGSGSCPGPWSQ